MAMRRFDALCAGFRTALHSAAEELADAGFKKAFALEKDILEKRHV